jgi:hypothetical protein
MHYSNTKQYVFIIILFCSWIHFANASLEITEIVYDPIGANTNHQWIEIYNTDSTPVSIDTTWRFNDGSSHYINDKVSFTVQPLSYFILTGDKDTFMIDHPSFSGLVIDTIMSLDKDGETISLIKDSVTIAEVTYNSSMGASENNNSLQKINNTWTEASPTIGVSNNVLTIPSDASSSNGSAGDTTTTTQKNKTSEIASISTEIITKKIAIAGIPFQISAETLGLNKEKLTEGKFVWNFGDGMQKIDTRYVPFEYMYEYEGEYVLTLSYYRYPYYPYEEFIDASDRMIIKVVAPGVVISSAGNDTDAFVELHNNSSYEIALSKWILKGVEHSFIIPTGTTLLSGKKLKFSPRVTGFLYSDLQSISLLNPAGDSIAVYPQEEKIAVSKKTILSSANITKATVYKDSSDLPVLENLVNLNNLEAQALNTNKNINPQTFAWIGLAGVIILGIVSVLFIGKKNSSSGKDKDDLEKELSADDMVILE